MKPDVVYSGPRIVKANCGVPREQPEWNSLNALDTRFYCRLDELLINLRFVIDFLFPSFYKKILNDKRRWYGPEGVRSRTELIVNELVIADTVKVAPKGQADMFDF